MPHGVFSLHFSAGSWKHQKDNFPVIIFIKKYDSIRFTSLYDTMNHSEYSEYGMY